MKFVTCLVSILCLAALSACSSSPNAVISAANPSSISFTGGLGHSFNGSFSFDNLQDRPLNYQVQKSVDWLEIVSTPQGTLLSKESVIVHFRAVCPQREADLSTSIIIMSALPDQSVQVRLKCSSQAILGEIPAMLDLSGQSGTRASSSFILQNYGGSTLTYEFSADQSWLSLSPASGSLKAASTQLINLSALCPTATGVYEASLTISSNDPAQPSSKIPVKLSCQSQKVSEFSIQLQYIGVFSPAQKSALEKAAKRWSKIITGDLPDKSLSKAFNICGIQDPEFSGLIDDVMIAVTVGPIDGQGNVFADAGPCALRDTLPLYSTIKLDAADITSFESSGNLEELMLRSIGRALGFGTLWARLDKLSYNPSASACHTLTSFSTRPTFNGATAKTQYNALGASGNPPIEDGLNAEVRCSSWDEQVFGNELMTSVFDKGKENPLSTLTIAAMQDIGYETDLSQASPYSLPACPPNCIRALVSFYDTIRLPILHPHPGLRFR